MLDESRVRVYAIPSDTQLDNQADAGIRLEYTCADGTVLTAQETRSRSQLANKMVTAAHLYCYAKARGEV